MEYFAATCMPDTWDASLNTTYEKCLRPTFGLVKGKSYDWIG